MIRIIHLSDFHLNKKSLKDWNNYLKPVLLKKLLEIHNHYPITFIAFTGDLIDIGGSDFDDIKTAFKIFDENIVAPILDFLSLNRNNFIIIPGNHDIDRTKDSRPSELGYQQYFKEDYANVLNFVIDAEEKSDFTGMERMRDFKDYEKLFYQDLSNSEITVFGSTHKLVANRKKIGIAALNSSWRCYSKDDMGKLIISEQQVAKCILNIEDCDIKIALMHHPLDWLIENERETITNYITKEFDLLLLGHVHLTKTSMSRGFTGTLFTNISPSGLNDIRSDSRQFSNGFTVIDYDSSSVSCEYYRYNHDLKSFTLNTDIAENGKFELEVPSEKSKKKQTIELELIANIKEDHFPIMDEHLIGTKMTKSNLNLKEAFVMPPINQGRSSEESEIPVNLTISEVLKSPSNFIFFGDQECGKTTLLYRIIREFVDEYPLIRKIPVYIDFLELGNKEFITAIKDYLRCSSDTAKSLLRENSVVLLIDNLNYKKHILVDQRNKLHNFSNEYEGVRIIATSESFSLNLLSSDYIELCRIPFKNYFVQNLRSQEIKSVIKQWMPDENELKSEIRLEKLVDNFYSYSLPSSVMSVSLFLWSMEFSDKKPINNAVLMEIYIEILLEKLGKHNIYRENFDFTNKIQLLAKIAHSMLDSEEPNYAIPFSQFEKIVETYLQEVGFNFDGHLIVEYFLERRIFVKLQNNKIKFKHSCFFHFFIAKRMIFNPEFKKYVLDENNYFNFSREIDYYSGLSRSDEDLLKLIVERFEKIFSNVDPIYDQVDYDKYFTVRENKNINEHEPLIKNFDIPGIKANRPTKEMMEQFHNEILENIPDSGTITPKNKKEKNSFEGMLVLMANVLRNSEGVENRQLKKRAYNSMIRNSMIWMVLYREYLLKFFKKYQRIPDSIYDFEDFIFTLKNLPLGVEEGMNRHLGTPKLAPIVLEKIKEGLKNSSVSDTEIFLSIAFYADIEGNDFPKYLKALIKRVGKNSVRDYLFMKLLDFYYRRTRPGSTNEKMYLDLITELKMRTKKLPHRLKEKVMKAIEDAKKDYLKIEG